MAYRLIIASLIALNLAYLYQARQIPLDPWSAEELVNSRTLPTVYAGLLAVVLVTLLLRPAPHVRFPRHVGGTVALFAVSLAFVWLLPVLGIWISSGLLLLSAFLVMGERRPVPILALTLGIPLFGWITVEQLLGIYVPGPWR